MYKSVAIAGTFDRLHKGHRFFISQAFRYGYQVLIGLTSDAFVNSKLKTQNSKLQFKAQNYLERKRQLEVFLKEEGFFEKTTITKIDDVYGPAIENNEIEALVVTSDTLEGGREVNRKRRSLGLPPLKLIRVPLVPAEDNKRIASTRIRVGEIDRLGKVYFSKVKSQKSKVKSEVRLRLKKPLGELINGESENPKAIEKELKQLIKERRPAVLITVGDVATKLCNEVGLPMDLAIIDYKVGRKKIYNSLSDLGFKNILFSRGREKIVYNPPGFITKSLITAIIRAMKDIIATDLKQVIRVIGEEDLAGVPAILLAPLGSLVLYGQPGEGIVAVEVTEEKKTDLLEKINNGNIS